MGETCNWPDFYQALCWLGPQLLRGIDDEGVVEIITMTAADTDSFWSDDLQPLLDDGAADGDLLKGVLAALEQWRQNVLSKLSEDFCIDLDTNKVTIDVDSPLINNLVDAAVPN